MKLHTKKSYLTNMAEGKAKRRRLPKLSQMLYFALLSAGIFYAAYYFTDRALSFSGYALVEVEKLKIRTLYGGLVREIAVEKRQSFSKGDLLARLGPAEICEEKSNDQAILDVKYDIEKVRRTLLFLTSERRLLSRQLENLAGASVKLRRALELNAPLSQRDESNKLASSLALKDIEIDSKQAELRALEQHLNNLLEQPIRPLPATCFVEEIRAPVNGKLVAVRVSLNQDTRAGDALFVVIPEHAEIGINLYVDYDIYSDVSIGKRMDVFFPDGVTSTATVVTIESAASTEGELDVKQYEPLMPKLLVRLAPTSSEERKLWANYDLSQVKVKGRR